MALLEQGITLSRNTAITVSASLLIMLGGALVTATVNYNNLQNRVTQDTNQIQINSDKISKLDNDNINAKVQLSGIAEQLKNIDANILEVKQKLEK